MGNNPWLQVVSISPTSSFGRCQCHPLILALFYRDPFRTTIHSFPLSWLYATTTCLLSDLRSNYYGADQSKSYLWRFLPSATWLRLPASFGLFYFLKQNLSDGAVSSIQFAEYIFSSPLRMLGPYNFGVCWHYTVTTKIFLIE